MEFEGTVFLVLPLSTGEGARGPWQRQDVVFDLPGDFDRKVSVEFWGDRATKASALRPGDRVTVSFRIDSREYQGRWYTRATGMNINYPKPQEQTSGNAPQQQQQQQNTANNNNQYPQYSSPNNNVENNTNTNNNTTQEDNSDDLPF